MNIRVELKSNYGVEAIYPVCDKAKLFASIAGTRTLTRAALKDIAALGYEIIIDAPKPIVFNNIK